MRFRDGLRRGLGPRRLKTRRGVELFSNLSRRRATSLCRYSTVKVVALFAVPPGVVTEIFPVTAPVGTVVVICLSELTVNGAALVPNFTDVV
jgi:hypothetical protein